MASLLRMGGTGGLLVLMTVSVQAEIIKQKRDGRELRGQVSGMTKTDVTIKPSVGDPVKIPANNIQYYWPDTAGSLRTGEGAFQRGEHEKAIEEFQKATASDAKMKAELDFLVARSTALLALSGGSIGGKPVEMADAIKKLADFKQNQPSHFRYYDALSLLGDLYLENKATAEAEAAFTELGQAPWKDYQMASQISQARLKLAQGQVPEALQVFETVSKMPVSNPAEKARKMEALLGKATAFYQTQQYDESVTVLNEVIKDVAEDNTRLQAEVYLRKGDCLLAKKETKAALLAYLHVDVLFANESKFHAEALYHLASLWAKVDKADRAAEAKDKLLKDYEKSEWAEKYKKERTTP